MVTINAQTSVTLIIINTLCIVLSFVFVSLRLLARYLKRTPLRSNDWLLVVALLFQVCQSVVEDLSTLLYCAQRLFWLNSIRRCQVWRFSYFTIGGDTKRDHIFALCKWSGPYHQRITPNTTGLAWIRWSPSLESPYPLHQALGSPLLLCHLQSPSRIPHNLCSDDGNCNSLFRGMHFGYYLDLCPILQRI